MKIDSISKVNASKSIEHNTSFRTRLKEELQNKSYFKRVHQDTTRISNTNGIDTIEISKEGLEASQLKNSTQIRLEQTYNKNAELPNTQNDEGPYRYNPFTKKDFIWA